MQEDGGMQTQLSAHCITLRNVYLVMFLNST